MQAPLKVLVFPVVCALLAVPPAPAQQSPEGKGSR